MKDKNIKTLVYLLIGLVFLGGCSYFIYNLTYVEPIHYDTVIEIYRNENEYKAYLKEDPNKKLVGYNLYKTVGLNLNGEEIDELMLNTDYNELNGIIIHYKSDYYSYYNFENDKNLFKDLKLHFANWNNKYIATTTGLRGQYGINYNSIYDISEEKEIIDNLNSFGQSNLYFLKSNDNNYFYIDSHTCEQINTLCNKINIYDSKGELVYTTINQNGYIVDFKEVPTNLNMTYEVEGYYEAKDGKIKKYNFEHEEIKSDLYDELLFVGMSNYVDYDLVYKSNDNYVYLLSSDTKIMKKIITKDATDYCIVKNNESLHIYETKCSTINNATRYFNYNIKSNQVSEVSLDKENE